MAKKYKMMKISEGLHRELTAVKKSLGKNGKGKPMTFEDLFSLLTSTEKFYRLPSRNYFGQDLPKARGYALERSARLNIKSIEWPEVYVYLGQDKGE